MLAKRTTLITESNTSKMRNKANELKAKGIPVVNFAAGELDLDTSVEIKISAEAAIRDKQNKYTDTLGIKPLREWISQKVSKDTGISYDIDEVGVTGGAKQALFNAALSIFDAEDEVIIPAPYWGTFEAQIILSGAKPVIFDTTSNGYQIDIEKLKKLITKKTKGIILNTPNNPTGVIYKLEILLEIAQLALKNKFWVIFDECYEALVYVPYKHQNIVSMCPELKERTIIINSFSKTYAITGWRIGYVAAPKRVIKAIKDIQGHTTSNPSSIAQYAILAVFEKNHQEYVKNINNVLSERLNKAQEILDTIPSISYVKPQGAFYIYPNIKKIIGKKYRDTIIESAADLAEILLSDAHAAVVPGNSFFDPTGFRLSYAISKKDVVEGITNMKKIFSEISENN